MKPEELQLGDIVATTPSGMPIKVVAIHRKKVAYHACTDRFSWVRIGLLQPIPLACEILKKNGFTGGEYKSWTGDVWYLEEEGFRKIGLTMSRKESTLWGEKIKPLSPDSIGYNFAVPNIKYVHELQHALRLCGIDKEIEI